jgi:tetrahydromethanopterin S-methyltransferase subunit G
MDEGSEGIRDRVTRSGEDAIGRLAQEMLDNPVVSGALARAFEAREKATQAQGVAMGALNLPSANDVERLTRRIRSLGQRLDGIEDSVDAVNDRLATGAAAGISESLESITETLDGITERLDAIEKKLELGS